MAGKGPYRWHWWLLLLVGILAGVLLGATLFAFFSNHVSWHEFWKAPAVSGIFIFGSALLAFAAALNASRVSRTNAVRDEWWNRAEWALEKALSKERSERVVGLLSMQELAADATESEKRILVIVSKEVASTVEG